MYEFMYMNSYANPSWYPQIYVFFMNSYII